MTARDFILKELQRKYTLDKETDIESFNYLESGYIDSIGIIQFLASLEEAYDIEFTDAEIADPSFKIVGQLAQLVERKVMENERSKAGNGKES